MSGTRKLLVGGSMAGLVLSLTLPAGTNLGHPASGRVQAGDHPQPSQPLVLRHTSQPRSWGLPQLSVPDSLKFPRESVAPAELTPIRNTNMHQYRRPGQSRSVNPVRSYPLPPEDGGPVQDGAFFSPEGEAEQQMAERRHPRGAEETSEGRGGGVFGRMFNRLLGRFSDSSEDSTAARRPRRSDGGDAPREGRRHSVESDEIVPYVDLPESSETPVADVIIPPQPQPNLLPDIDFADPSSFLPATPEGVATSEHDPFPLPPLPDGFKRSGNRSAQTQQDKIAERTRDTAEAQSSTPTATETKESTTEQLADSDAMLLPPLPEGTKQAPAKSGQLTAQAEPQSSSEDNVRPEAEKPAAFPEAAELAEDSTTPALSPEEALKAELDAMHLPLPESNSVAEKSSSAQEQRHPLAEPPHTEQPQVAAKSAVPTDSPEAGTQNSSKKKSGEKDTNLPLAPSVDNDRWQSRPDSHIVQDQQQQVPADKSGWRSRDHQPKGSPADEALTKPDKHEPNTLNVPEEARLAEVPPSRTAQQESPQEKYRRIAERGERTGFKGFCPVALKDYLELEDASPRFRAEFEGQLYYFSSQECLQQFQQDPIRYVPVNNGLDLVKFIKEGSEEPGRLDFAVWYQDRLFLFSSQNTLETFRAEPRRFLGEE